MNKILIALVAAAGGAFGYHLWQQRKLNLALPKNSDFTVPTGGIVNKSLILLQNDTPTAPDYNQIKSKMSADDISKYEAYIARAKALYDRVKTLSQGNAIVQMFKDPAVTAALTESKNATEAANMILAKYMTQNFQENFK